MRGRGGQKTAAHISQISHHFGRFVIWQFGQNGTLQIASSAPGARRTARRRKVISRTKQNGHFRRQTRLTLAPEWSIWNRKGPFWNRKGTKKHPEKNCQACPLVLRVKNRTLRSASSQQKIDKRFPPSGVLKRPHSDRQVTKKTPKTKLSSVSPSFKG